MLKKLMVMDELVGLVPNDVIDAMYRSRADRGDVQAEIAEENGKKLVHRLVTSVSSCGNVNETLRRAGFKKEPVSGMVSYVWRPTK